MFSVWGSADGTSWPGAHRDHLLHWGAAVSLQCPLWRGQSCGEDTLGRVGVENSPSTLSSGEMVPGGPGGEADWPSPLPLPLHRQLLSLGSSQLASQCTGEGG